MYRSLSWGDETWDDKVMQKMVREIHEAKTDNLSFWNPIANEKGSNVAKYKSKDVVYAMSDIRDRGPTHEIKSHLVLMRIVCVCVSVSVCVCV